MVTWCVTPPGAGGHTLVSPTWRSVRGQALHPQHRHVERRLYFRRAGQRGSTPLPWQWRGRSTQKVSVYAIHFFVHNDPKILCCTVAHSYISKRYGLGGLSRFYAIFPQAALILHDIYNIPYNSLCLSAGLCYPFYRFALFMDTDCPCSPDSSFFFALIFLYLQFYLSGYLVLWRTKLTM